MCLRFWQMEDVGLAEVLNFLMSSAVSPLSNQRKPLSDTFFEICISPLFCFVSVKVLVCLAWLFQLSSFLVCLDLHCNIFLFEFLMPTTPFPSSFCFCGWVRHGFPDFGYLRSWEIHLCKDPNLEDITFVVVLSNYCVWVLVMFIVGAHGSHSLVPGISSWHCLEKVLLGPAHFFP